MVAFDAKNWRQIDELPAMYGPLTLHESGEFSWGPLRLDQSSRFSNTDLGHAVVNKEAGIRLPLVIQVKNGPTIEFRFDGNHWQVFGELGRDYEEAIGQGGLFYLACKNWVCNVMLAPSRQETEGPLPRIVTCGACGCTDIYDGSDIQFFANG
jgi:hypothetical protein